MSNAITFRDKMDVDDFDPMKIDISEFEELAKSMPLDANIDLCIAETLAVQFLRAADRCCEILSTLIWHEGQIKAKKNAIRNRLYLEAKDVGYKTDAERKAYSESQEQYVVADMALATAYTARRNFEMKHEYFLKSHQYMKEKMKVESKQQSSSGFSETSGYNGFGEKDWT
jgi:hypothetical protein